MPHCGEHLPEEKSLAGDSSHYRLHGGRRSATATVAVGTSDAATISTRCDDRREGFSNRRRRNDQRGDGQHGERDETAAAAVVAQRTTNRRLQLGMELRRGETSWSHRGDELRRRTTTQQRGVVDGEFLTVGCPMATTAQHQFGRSSRRKLAFPTVDENTLDHSIPDGDSATAADVGELGTDES